MNLVDTVLQRQDSDKVLSLFKQMQYFTLGIFFKIKYNTLFWILTLVIFVLNYLFTVTSYRYQSNILFKRDDRSFDLIPEKEQKSLYLTFYFTKKVKSIFSIIYFKLHEGCPWKLQTKRNLLFVCIRGLYTIVVFWLCFWYLSIDTNSKWQI